MPVRARPPRVQVVKWRDEQPADPALRQAADRFAAAMRRWDDRASPDLFAATGDLTRTRKEVARLGDDTPKSIVHLRCDEGPLELQLTVDAATGRISDFSGYPPRDPDATCWQ